MTVSRWLFILAIPALLAQPVDQPILRVGTRLVQFNVIVRDRKGPVDGLTRKNFRIFDRGVERSVALFQANSRSGDNAKFAEALKLPPSMTSNAQADAANITVVLFDGLNTALQDQIYAKRQVLKFLSQVKPNDRVGIYVLGSSVKVLHEFTSDTASLMAAVRQFRGDSSGAGGGTGLGSGMPSDAGPGQGEAAKEFNNRFKEFNKKLDDMVIRNRVLITVEALRSIARHLERMAGRKNLVWVSSSFPISLDFFAEKIESDRTTRDHPNFSGEMEQAARALMKANVAVYPVDARGLMIDARYSATEGTGADDGWGFLEKFNAPAVPLGYLEQTTMTAIAERTGGKAYYNTNDIMGSIRRALDDSDLTYTIGFYLPQADMDERFHEVKIAVDRKGVEVRTRKGYLADKELDGAAGDSAARRRVMREVLNAPLDATGLTVAIRLDRADAIRPGAVAVSAFVDPRLLAFHQQKDEFVDTLETAIVQQAADGRILDVVSERLVLRSKAERFRQLMAGSVDFRKVVDLKADAAFLRLVVFDDGSGLVGSARATLGWVRSEPPQAIPAPAPPVKK